MSPILIAGYRIRRSPLCDGQVFPRMNTGLPAYYPPTLQVGLPGLSLILPDGLGHFLGSQIVQIFSSAPLDLGVLPSSVASSLV